MVECSRQASCPWHAAGAVPGLRRSTPPVAVRSQGNPACRSLLRARATNQQQLRAPLLLAFRTCCFRRCFRDHRRGDWAGVGVARNAARGDGDTVGPPRSCHVLPQAPAGYGWWANLEGHSDFRSALRLLCATRSITRFYTEYPAGCYVPPTAEILNVIQCISRPRDPVTGEEVNGRE
jgi:hypothetical protein